MSDSQFGILQTSIRIIHENDLTVFFILKGVFAKNEMGYRLNAIKKRF